MIKIDASKPKVKVSRPDRPVYLTESTETIIDQGATTELADEDATILRSTTSTVRTEGNISSGLEAFSTYESLDPDIATAGADGRVSRVADGTARILARSAWDRQRFDVAVSETGGVTTDKFVSWVSGSLAKHATDNIESAIVGLTPSAATLDMFSTVDHGAGNYTRNSSQWCSAHQNALTGFNAWHSVGGQTRAQTAITKRHIVGAAHYPNAGSVGATVRFVAADGTVVDRVVTHTRKIEGRDIQTSLLNADLPTSITPVSVLPSTWSNHLRHMATTGFEFLLPCLLRNQFGEARIYDLRKLDNTYAIYTDSMPASRIAWQRDISGGDSGGPAMLIVGGKLVLVTTWANIGIGPPYHPHNWSAELSALDTLAGISTGYTPSVIDLSGFTSFA